MAACLPYLLLAAFVDFVHVDRQAETAAPASDTVRLAGPAAPAGAHDQACPICAWLRVGPGLDTPIAPGACADLVARMIAPIRLTPPESPVPLPAQFRGPPPFLA
jgi:hypothetical protein